MITATQTNFIHAVADAYSKPLFYGPTLEGKIAYEFSQMLKGNHHCPQQIETCAQSILSALADTRGKRYRHTTEKQNATSLVFQEIFEQAYKKNPSALFWAAQIYQKRHFYPLTPTILLISIPDAIGKVVGNPLAKLALSIYCCVKGYQLCRYVLYPFFEAHIVPVVVNWTPTLVARTVSVLINAQTLIAAICIIAILGKWIASRRTGVNFRRIRFPEDPVSFTIRKSFEAFIFILRTCSSLQATCSLVAKQEEAERARICKPQVAAAWNHLMRELVRERT